MTSREQFEHWARNAGFYVTTKNDDYLYPATNDAWLAWKRSREAIELNLTSEWDISSDGSRHYDADSVDEQLLASGIKVKK